MKLDDIIKAEIDVELNEIKISECMKQNIRKSIREKKEKPKLGKMFGSLVALFALCTTTVVAGYVINSQISVNDETLPELEMMQITKIDGESDIETYVKNASSYKELSEKLNVKLLESDLANDEKSILMSVDTDNTDFALITIENYITGDVKMLDYDSEIQEYRYDVGEIYKSPINLSVDIILSEEQMRIGWERDYLGLYEYQESYISEQGYKVNVVKDKIEDSEVEAERCAIFVADGIRYILTGRVDTKTLKEIVNTMK